MRLNKVGDYLILVFLIERVYSWGFITTRVLLIIESDLSFLPFSFFEKIRIYRFT